MYVNRMMISENDNRICVLICWNEHTIAAVSRFSPVTGVDVRAVVLRRSLVLERVLFNSSVQRPSHTSDREHHSVHVEERQLN